MVTGSFERNHQGEWVWLRKTNRGGETKTESVTLGNTLSATVYRLGEHYRSDDLRAAVSSQIERELEALTEEQRQAQRKRWSSTIQGTIEDIELRQQQGSITQEDVLDRPILRILNNSVRQQMVSASAADH